MKTLQFVAMLAAAAFFSTQAIAEEQELSASDKAVVVDMLTKSGLSQKDAEDAIASKTLKDPNLDFCKACRTIGGAVGDAGAAAKCAAGKNFVECALYMAFNVSAYVQSAMEKYKTTCETVTKTKFVACLTLPDDTKKLLSLVCPNFSCK